MNVIMHRKVLSDGTITKDRKRLDPNSVLPRAEAEASGKPYWLPEVHDTQSSATGSVPPVVEKGEWTLEADRVYQLTTIRDMTPTEVQEQLDNKTEETALTPAWKMLKLLMAGQFWLVNDVRSRAGQNAITPAAYLTNLDTFASQFSDTAFKAKIKELLDA